MQIYISFAKRSTAIRKKTHFFILHLPPEAHPPQAPLSHPPGHGHRLLNKNSPDSIPLYRQATATLSAKRRQPTGNPSPSLLQASSTLPTSLRQTIAKPPPPFRQASNKPSPSHLHSSNKPPKNHRQVSDKSTPSFGQKICHFVSSIRV